MAELKDYKRSGKLYQSGDEVFVKPRYWPESIEDIDDGVTLERGEKTFWRGEHSGYEYNASFDTEQSDPSYPDSDVYGWDAPEVPEGEEFVPIRKWPQQIDLTDGTVLVKKYGGKGVSRYAYYQVETWGDLDPSLPSSAAYENAFGENEFDKPGKYDYKPPQRRVDGPRVHVHQHRRQARSVPLPITRVKGHYRGYPKKRRSSR